MFKKLTTPLLLLSILFVFGCTPISTETPVKEVEMDLKVEEVTSESRETNEPIQTTYDYIGSLTDVTGSSSSGRVKVSLAEGVYSLMATFDNLPDPEGTDFYEGWIVRKGAEFSVISTGVASKIDGVYTNLYGIDQDLSDHDFYVLTIEPDDGDPAPADHVLEGTLKKQ